MGRAADAPRASACRAWSDADSEVGPQVRFHDALIAKLLREEPGFGREESNNAFGNTLVGVENVLADMPDLVGLDSTQRGHRLRQIHRAGSNANASQMNESALWQCYVAAAAGLMSQQDVSASLWQAWRDGERG